MGRKDSPSENIVFQNLEDDSKVNLADYFYLLLQHTDLCIYLEERPFGLHPRNTKVSRSALFSRDIFFTVFCISPNIFLANYRYLVNPILHPYGLMIKFFS